MEPTTHQVTDDVDIERCSPPLKQSLPVRASSSGHGLPLPTVEAWVSHLKHKRNITDADFQHVPENILDKVREKLDAIQRKQNLDKIVQDVIEPAQDHAAFKYSEEEEGVHIIEVATKHAVTLKQRRAKAKDNLLVAIDCGPDRIKSRKRSMRMRKMSMLVFFIVLAGCEMDFIGFAMAFQQYWTFQGEGAVIVKAMLIAMPLSFILAIFLFLYAEPDEVDGPALPQAPHQTPQHRSTGGALEQLTGVAHTHISLHDVAVANKANLEESRKQMEAVMKVAAKDLVVRQKFTIKFFHFLPLLRTVLVVKSIDENDVEGIFRVNSLSSFTLGFAQLVGMVFTIFVSDTSDGPSLDFNQLPLVVKINIGSFLVNWLITIAYFGTPIAAILKKCAEVDALRCNLDRELEEKNAELLACANQDAYDAASDEDVMLGSDNASIISSIKRDQGDKVRFHKKCLSYEISILHGVSADLQCFRIPELIDIQKEVYRKQIEMHVN